MPSWHRCHRKVRVLLDEECEAEHLVVRSQRHHHSIAEVLHPDVVASSRRLSRAGIHQLMMMMPAMWCAQVTVIVRLVVLDSRQPRVWDVCHYLNLC